jgi:2-ketocyclohexanecarboxyl-CoA hydrolase
MDYEHIIYETDDGVARLTINRPEVLNAFTRRTLHELEHAYGVLAADHRVGVVVLTGAGERAFCAGGDVRAEAEGWLEDRGGEEDCKRVYAAMRASLKPTIARVNGYAIGGGNHLAYMCDLTIAADHAIFGQNGPRVASPAQGWLVSYLVRVVGAKRAREIWLLCGRLSAQQALNWGLVNAVVPMSELDKEVRRWCDEMLALSPTALKVLKRTFDQEFEPLRAFQDSEDYLRDVNPGFFDSGEQDEGARAFIEKRAPDFSRWR